MAQAHAKARNGSDQRYFLGSDPRTIPCVNEAALPRLCRARRSNVESGGFLGSLKSLLGASTEHQNRRLFGVIRSQMPASFHVVAVCYVTAILLLAWFPSNILLVLIPLLFPSTSKRLRFSAPNMKSSTRGGVRPEHGSEA
jgi:hypothetical protein